MCVSKYGYKQLNLFFSFRLELCILIGSNTTWSAFISGTNFQFCAYILWITFSNLYLFEAAVPLDVKCRFSPCESFSGQGLRLQSFCTSCFSRVCIFIFLFSQLIFRNISYSFVLSGEQQAFSKNIYSLIYVSSFWNLNSALPLPE
jgi:hypothetical protein